MDPVLQRARRRTIFGAFFILLSASLIGLSVYRSTTRTQAAIVALPNGWHMQVIGIAPYGVQFTTETRFKSVLRKYAPRFIQRHLGTARTYSCGGSPGSYTLYVALTSTNQTRASWGNWSYVAVDETGFRYAPESSRCTSTEPNGETVGLILQAFPRRQKEFDLEVLDEKRELLARLKVPVPPQQIASWSPAPVPQKATNGPVTLTLLGIRQSREPAYSSLHSEFRVDSTDPAWAKPRNQSSFQDATGNQGHWLSPREPVWRVDTLLYRERLQDFAPDEQMTLTNITVPAAGEYTTLGERVRLGNAALEFKLISGPAYLVISNGVLASYPNPSGRRGSSSSSGTGFLVEEWWTTSPGFQLTAEGLLPAEQLFFDVRDAQGRPVRLESTYASNIRGSMHTYFPRLVSTPWPSQISISVAVNRPLSFQYFVNPTNALAQP